MEDTDYRHRHYLVAKIRGKARDHDCELCGNSANEWSTVHDTDGTDPHNHYRALCNKCHRDYDGTTRAMIEANTGRQKSQHEKDAVAESNRRRRGEVREPRPDDVKAKISESHKGKTLSEEHRQKIAESTRGKKRSPETRERMRQAALKRWEVKRGGSA